MYLSDVLRFINEASAKLDHITEIAADMIERAIRARATERSSEELGTTPRGTLTRRLARIAAVFPPPAEHRRTERLDLDRRELGARGLPSFYYLFLDLGRAEVRAAPFDGLGSSIDTAWIGWHTS